MMKNNSNIHFFSATEQIERISETNTSKIIDKKEMQKQSSVSIFDLINKLDKKVVSKHKIYPSILVPWKLEELK